MVANHYRIQVLFVASYQHHSTKVSGQWVYVDPDREAADLYIVNHVSTGDLVVTQDMGLAGLLTQRGVYILTPRGKSIHEGNISSLLDQRYISKKLREKGHRTKGPKAMSSEDKAVFKNALIEWVQMYHHGDD
ncbi:DUF188 domain-containing protein [Pullulanibacillus sp. KACC 23026]|uniref:YaiI/YqxD family protein n=1 Tax=Pullulanibacillus sp. KACC 23026 TaxID=3028315 RepID=UPI0023B16D91|nr:DUF188 domain-containing protein [Pullulanibacillus sp. KACC 23026]WEG14245.1 DUF188 domain-containing protein [Pullulanibacillus sp. KACC 23026]